MKLKPARAAAYRRAGAAVVTSGSPARILRASFCGVALLFFAAFGAVKATVTDVSGQAYNVTSMRFTKDSSPMRFVRGFKLAVDCGGAKMELPLKNIKSIKINPKQISSIGGKLHFGVELLLRDSTVVGGGGRCCISADNGIAGKSSKGKFSLPFEKLSYVYILGKEDVEKKQPQKKGGAAEKAREETEQPDADVNETEQPVVDVGETGQPAAEQPEKEDDGENAREKE